MLLPLFNDSLRRRFNAVDGDSSSERGVGETERGWQKDGMWVLIGHSSSPSWLFLSLSSRIEDILVRGVTLDDVDGDVEKGKHSSEDAASVHTKHAFF